ncbi:MAG: hypothetical protein DWQ19_10450 [Crenarchaeota archaeon]|nr:MAG: hypothetical protein DWQ19_10450 [Thermoproteota archaeon]
MKLHFKDIAGLFAISWSGDTYIIHFFVFPQWWKLGHSIEEYDMCLTYFGAGPFFLWARWNF